MIMKFKKITLLYISFTMIFLFLYYPKTQHPAPEHNSNHLISVYRTENKTVTTIPLETYIKNVIACEVPSSFHIETLKAQAVASRTYAISKTESSANPDAHPLAPLCDTTHCQVYDDSFRNRNDINWRKIKKAVDDTSGELIYYQGKVVENALFHASSGGYTENSEDVFTAAVPYLRSVESPYETAFSRNGHGVGMSQQGAEGMAKEGFTYKKILSHYYSGTVVY